MPPPQAAPKRARADAAAEADERKRARAAGVVTRVESLDAAAADALLADLCGRWLLAPEAAGATIDQTIAVAFANFGVRIESSLLDSPELGGGGGGGGLAGLVERIHDHETEAVALFNHLRGLELLPTAGADEAADAGADEAAARLKRMVKVLEQVWYGKKVVTAAYQARLAAHAAGSDDVRVDDSLDAQLASWGIRFRWIDVSTTNPMQNLLLHLLDCAMERKYRKQLGWCYEPILIDGHPTHAWRQVMEIRDFVHSMIAKETSWEQWCNATTNTKNISSAVEYLTNCVDYQFPTLRKQRGVYAFRNGVYVARDDAFHAFGELPDSVVACKFFDLDFAPHAGGHWSDIPTPYLQSIMDYQQFPREVCDWMYILLGRLLYDLGDLDSWQVIPFFKGMASSGKSTVVLKVAKNFFEAIDVGVLSNNIERKFGLSAFADKYLFVAPEIKNDLQVEQAEFQSIVSGEDIQVNTKFAKAKSCVWKVPGVLAGNEVPGWADNSGSIQRRIVLFDFGKAVSNGDMKLGEKLEAELGATILKCNRAYLDMVSRHSHTNLWQVLPRYFHATRDEMAQAVNSVEAFLASTDVVLAPDAYMPFKEFKEALRLFEQTNGYKAGGKAQTADYWRGPFAKFRLERVHDKRFYRGQNLTRDYVVGVDLARLEDHGDMVM